MYYMLLLFITWLSIITINYCEISKTEAGYKPLLSLEFGEKINEQQRTLQNMVSVVNQLTGFRFAI